MSSRVGLRLRRVQPEPAGICAEPPVLPVPAVGSERLQAIRQGVINLLEELALGCDSVGGQRALARRGFLQPSLTQLRRLCGGTALGALHKHLPKAIEAEQLIAGEAQQRQPLLRLQRAQAASAVPQPRRRLANRPQRLGLLALGAVQTRAVV